ncbi:MAG: P63C domain-containing protein [Sulfuricellaceae bacterium]|nr:P63C domain-containing protein [Sulfuricellaceae bacterium]
MAIDPSIKGRARGGLTRSANMTPEQRSEAAKKAVQAREEKSKLPKATHTGSIKIGDADIQCAVLPDGTRILSERAIANAFGAKRGGSHWKRKRAGEPGADLPVFISAKNIVSCIESDLLNKLSAPILYIGEGGKVAHGTEASLLPIICNLFLTLRDDGKLHPSQMEIAKQADILMRGLAVVGIISLIDEATGYQKDRAKNALAQILEKFVAKELQAWVKTFPSNYYEELFRLYNLPYPPEGNKSWRPGFIGNITNDVVYSRIAPELLPELKKAASKAEKKAKLHQMLTHDIGHPKLREHLASIVTLLKLADTPKDFQRMVDRIHPRFGDTYQIDF